MEDRGCPSNEEEWSQEERLRPRRKKEKWKPQHGQKEKLELVGSGNCGQIVVEDQTVKCLIDTGSMISSISEEYYASHLNHKELQPVMSAFRVEGAGGHEISYVEVDVVLPGSECHVTVPVVVVAATKYNLDVPMIVGTNILRAMEERQIQDTGAWQSALENLVQQKGRGYDEVAVYTSSRVTVAPHQAIVVKARVGAARSYHMGMVEASDNNPGIVLPVSIVTIQDKLTNIEVLNLSPNTVEIPKGRKIGMLSAVQIVEDPWGQEETCTPVVQMKQQVQQTDVDVEIGVDLGATGLTLQQKELVQQMLRRNREVFAADLTELGCARGVKHRIELTDATPIKDKPRRVPPGLYDEVKKHIDEMLAVGAIRRSKSPWSSNVVLVRKKDGRLRVCIDYRKLNGRTVKDAYHLPLIEATLDQLAGAQWFSTLDLQSGYWQIELEEEDKAKTAFSIGNLGLFENR